MTIHVGLRIDVDTIRGTRDGVPALVRLLAKYDIQATFFMSVGPDNMGRNLWRLFKPKFLVKMLRSNAASLYGYETLISGTAWPGTMICKKLAHIIRLPHETGHEVGLHAWDHYTWQTHIDRFSEKRMLSHLQRGFDTLTEILGSRPKASAVPGWRANEKSLLLKERFGFSYNSDCRGKSLFVPMVGGKTLTTQIPTTLPTYDEVIGTNGISLINYNSFIISQCRPGQLNVYTIHAEVEGISLLGEFEKLLIQARKEGIKFQPLRNLLAAQSQPLHVGEIIKSTTQGREGWMAWQE